MDVVSANACGVLGLFLWENLQNGYAGGRCSFNKQFCTCFFSILGTDDDVYVMM